jgi:hypothetical protein
MDNPDDNFKTNGYNKDSSGPVHQSLEAKSSQINQASVVRSEPQIPGDGNGDSIGETSMSLQLLDREGGSSLKATNTVLAATQHAATQQDQEPPNSVRQDEQEGSSAQEKIKKDRSKLRKGKWTVCCVKSAPIICLLNTC